MLNSTLIFIAAMSISAGAQRARPVHILAYDPVAYQQFLESQRVPKMTEPEKTSSPSSGTATNKPASSQPAYVYISGNFGGVFSVSGVGAGTSQTQSNLVNITTNRALTFWANSFKPLQLSGSSEGAMGSVTYSMALYQGTSSHVGALIAGPVSGTDSGFNGQSVAVNSAQISGGGSLVLLITRTLSLTGQVKGASTFKGTGFIGVTIN